MCLLITPSAHISQNALYMVGGAVVFFSGDVKVLSDDMKIAKPTLLPGEFFFLFDDVIVKYIRNLHCSRSPPTYANILQNSGQRKEQCDQESTPQHRLPL